MLTADLDGEDEKDKGALDNLLSQLIAELGMDRKVMPSHSARDTTGWVSSQVCIPLLEGPPLVSVGNHPRRAPVVLIQLKRFSVPTLAQAYFWIWA